MRRPRALTLLGSLAVGLGFGLLEAQRLEGRTFRVVVPGLPSELDGLRVLHLSDFHLGSVSLNGLALRRAVDWAAGRELDLAVITGDLLSRPRGEAALRAALARLSPAYGTYVVLGNHDVAITRDPFSAAREIADLEADGAEVLRDSSRLVDVRGLRVQIAGLDPRSYLAGSVRAAALADASAELRILLCHYPPVVDGLAPGAFDLVLAGHMHGGQICLPYPGGKLRFGGFELFPRYPEGVFELEAATLVVSRGTGTAFVPFRLFARPEAAVLVLNRP